MIAGSLSVGASRTGARESDMHRRPHLVSALVAASVLSIGLSGLAALPVEPATPVPCLADGSQTGDDLHARGYAEYEAGNYEQAVPLLQRAVEMGPDAVSYRNDLGLALHALDRDAEARAALEGAVRVAPDSAMAHFNLAGVLVALGEREAAVWEYREARRLEPGSPGIWNDLAATLMELGWAMRAEMEYSLLVQRHADYANGWFGYAVVLERSGRGGDARAAWGRFLELCENPESPFAQTARERLAGLETRLSAKAR